MGGGGGGGLYQQLGASGGRTVSFKKKRGGGGGGYTRHEAVSVKLVLYGETDIRTKLNGRKSSVTLKTFPKKCWPLGIFIHLHLTGCLF